MGSYYEAPLLHIKPYPEQQPFQYNSYPSDSEVLRIIPLDVRKEPLRKRPKYTRSKLGCLTCRAKKVKCDEVKPKCTRCTQGHRECTWPEGGHVPRRRGSIAKKTEERPSTANSDRHSSSSSSPLTREPSPHDRERGVHLPQLPSFALERRSSIHSDYSHPSPALPPYDPHPTNLNLDSVQEAHHNYNQAQPFPQPPSHHSSMVPQSAPPHTSYFYPPNDVATHHPSLSRSYEHLPPMDITRLPPSYYLSQSHSHYSSPAHYGSQNTADNYSRPPALQWPLLNQDLPYPGSAISRHRQEVNDARYRPPVGAW